MDIQFSTDSVGLKEYLLHNRLICDGANILFCKI